ncbi:MAG: efflux RND transporter permease subunit [Ignavibacteria bacterium]|nr:efflux RND transporter permease subunit [Ignavibacteria bacterium]
MKNKFELIESLLHHKQLIFIITGIFILIGILGLIEMPRDEFPAFTIRQGIIVGVFPGASSNQVEEQLTTKVENYLFEYKSVERAKTYSVSKENVMVIYVEVSESENDPDAFWVKLRKGLDELKKELPSGVSSLTADNDFGNTSALLFAVQSETKTYKELEMYVKDFEKDVRRVESVSKVKHYGLQKEQISVYLDEDKIKNYGIKPLTVFTSIVPQNTVNYSGEIDDGNLIYPVRVPLNFKSEEDIANQIVFSDPSGNVIRLKDVAKIVREYPDPDSYVRVNGKKCLIVSLEMKPGYNIVKFGGEVSDAVEKFTNSLPQDVKLITISDVPNFVSHAIGNFLKEFLIAMISVILVTILLLPGRIAGIAALAIPTSILTAIGIMWAIGMDLQTVSLAGLIIVLGISVDDAIVIIDNYVEKLDKGISPREAASKSVTELFASVFTATLTIIACFIPIQFFMIGTAGDFVRSLPITITFALAISLIISVTLSPLVSYMFIKTGINNKKKDSGEKSFLDILQNNYDKLLEKVFTKKKLVVFVGGLTFIIGLLILAITPQQSFPKIERNQFAVEVYLPSGYSLKQTDKVMKEIEEILSKDKRIQVVTSFVGTSSPRFNALYAPNFPGKNYGQFVVLTESNEATVEILDEYTKKYRTIAPEADIRWKQLEMAVSKAPIEIRISGNDIKTIKQISDSVKNILTGIEGVSMTRTDFDHPVQSIDLAIKRDEAARLGYSNSIISYSLMLGTKGFPISTIWEGDYPVNVNLKIAKNSRCNPETIRNQYITSPYAVTSVPLRQIADLKPGWTEGQIVRRNGIRTLTVLADIDRDKYASKIFDKARNSIEEMDLPDGISISYGGEHQDSIEYITPFYYALAVSVVLIFLIIMSQFRNIKTTILIMLTMPLSVFGAALGMFITGYPFSVTAFIGLIGLMGIVVRNGIILISYANELQREHGHTLEEAAIMAGKRRMRPIFLTSAAAAVGVIPMIVSGSSLWGPLGSVICFGLLFALILSLIVLPVLYYYFHRNDFNKVEEDI